MATIRFSQVRHFASCQSSHHQIGFPFSDGDDGPALSLPMIVSISKSPNLDRPPQWGAHVC